MSGCQNMIFINDWSIAELVSPQFFHEIIVIVALRKTRKYDRLWQQIFSTLVDGRLCIWELLGMTNIQNDNNSTYCATQWAAVKICHSSMIDPSQNWFPLFIIITIQGHSLRSAGQPPATRSGWVPLILSTCSFSSPSALYLMALRPLPQTL